MAPSNDKKLSISQKILNATASLSKGTTKHVSRKKVAQLCGFPKKESRSYTNQIGILKNKKGYIIQVDSDTLCLTEAGLANADCEAPAASNRESLDKKKAQLKMGKGKQLFDLMSDGKTYTRTEIGAAIGSDPNNRSFNNILGPLKTAGFMEYVTKDGEKACRLVDDMFPFGRPGGEEESEEEDEEKD